MLQLKCSKQNTRGFITFIVYISLLLDNVLLTVIVPILPDYLAHFNENISSFNVPSSLIYKNFDLHYVPTILSKHPLTGKSLVNFTLGGGQSVTPATSVDTTSVGGFVDAGPPIMTTGNNSNSLKKLTLDDENVSIGILLAVKAFVQLIFNPIVGSSTAKFGYRIPIVFGTFNLLIASLVFAVGDNYLSLVFARAIQGIGSACIGVCGMSLVAQLYPEEDKRSKVMGIVLGSIALGVLIGYPIGGILYDFVGKAAPFYILSVFMFLNLGLQLSYLELIVQGDVIETENTKWWPLLTDWMILMVACAILISTSAMAILEPCLPIWLMANLNPKKWQLGTVFIPDSVGYLLGTNFFGKFAYDLGQLRVSIGALFLVGISCILIPSATSVISLLLPHFGLGLGIGILDAALVPYLASLVDTKYGDIYSNYGAVYAIQQMAVSLAYSFTPLIGGELAKLMGFPWLMRSIGAINCFYGPLLLLVLTRISLRGSTNKSKDILLSGTDSTGEGTNYKRFYNSIE